MLAYRKFAGGICVKVLENSGFMVVCPVFLWKTGCQSDIIGHISAFFDGDWAWCVNPFSLDDPRLRNGDKTMSFALSTYLNSDFNYVFFPSVVVVDKTIREAILKDITAEDYSVIGITLTCSEDTLRERHKKRGDTNACSFFWLHLKPYEGDSVIDTDNKSVQQIVDEIKGIIDGVGSE